MGDLVAQPAGHPCNVRTGGGAPVEFFFQIVDLRVAHTVLVGAVKIMVRAVVMNGIAAEVAAGCPERSSCGIGRPYAGICGLLRADDSARTALQMARAQGISCLTDDPAGVVRMIGSDSPEAAIASYVRDHLAPIFCQESGRRRELLDTLECWFVCFGNQRQMAQLMHLHYNTVAYRLHQLWGILPGGQPEGDARLALQTALYLYRQRPDICKRS